jgi:hypothetical protein
MRKSPDEGPRKQYIFTSNHRLRKTAHTPALKEAIVNGGKVWPRLITGNTGLCMRYESEARRIDPKDGSQIIQNDISATVS